MKLSTSDWIAILATLIQVAATIGVAIWQVKKSQAAPAIEEKERIRPSGSTSFRLFRKYWQSWVAIVAGVVGLLLLYSTGGPVGKFFVALSTVLSLMCFFHLIVIMAFEFMRAFSNKLMDLLLPEKDENKKT